MSEDVESEGGSATGRCHCGSARYRLIGEPLTTYACHCTDCQTVSGSAFTLAMILGSDGVELITGSLESKEFRLNESPLTRHQCIECSTPLWFSSSRYPGYLAVKAGTLDDAKYFRPQAHVWFRSAQSWFAVEEGVPVFDEQPKMSELIALASD